MSVERKDRSKRQLFQQNMKLFVVLSAILVATAAHHHHQCAAPGTTVVSKTVTTTTTSAGEGGEGYALVKSTWELARKNGNIAPKFFLRFLKTYPEYQKLFPSIANVPQAQLMKNGNFLSQAYTIAAGLNTIIQSLGSQELLAQEINHLGTTHFSRGATLPMFEQFGKVFTSVLEEEMGSRLSAEASEAFKKGFSYLVAAVSKTLKNPDQVPHPATGLTKSNIADVRRVWGSIRDNRVAVVDSAFRRLFAENPSLQKAFSAFADLPVADLSSNAEYLKQVGLVADRLDNMISTLDNTLQIMGQFKYMGHSHAARGIDRADFELFGRVFMAELAARGVSSDDLEDFRAVLRAGVQKIAENLY